MNLPIRILLCSAVVISPACSTLKKMSPFKKKVVPKAERVHPVPERVGVIVLVNEDDRFALIDTSTGVTPAPGTALKVLRGDSEVAVLNCGGVQRRQFVVADIATGEPSRGDVVFR